MMLMHNVFTKPITFDENEINYLIVENPALLTNMIIDLIGQQNGNDGEFVLSENYVPIEISKNAELVTDAFSIDVNKRKIITKLYSILTEKANTELYMQTNEIKAQISAYCQMLTEQVDFPLDTDCEPDISGLIKLCNIQLKEEGECIADKLYEYMKASREFLKKKFFVFVNIRSFVNETDMLNLYKMIQYEKYTVLFIESTDRDKISSNERYRIIDSTLCEIC